MKKRAGDIDVVERALELIEQVPPWDPALGSTSERGVIHRDLKAALKPLYGVLERLHVEFIPDSVSPGPLACMWARGMSGTPVMNLLKCFDLCVHCQEEAKRALRAVQDALLGRRISKPFLAPEERAGRLQRAERLAKDEAERNRRSMAHTLKSFEDLKTRLARLKRDPSKPAAEQRTSGDETEIPVLLPLERAVLDILRSVPPGRGIFGKSVLKKLDDLGHTTSQSYLTSDIIPKLRKLGISIPKSGGRRGYRIADALPAWVAKLPPVQDRH